MLAGQRTPRNNGPGDNRDGSTDKASPSPPTISLPKGGGAIRGIGEKFAANPVTGTGSMTVPIATSPGRSNFGPQLALSYDSGAGNGPFGFGWSLSLPQITRKTDKGLPQYNDAEESDVFILSGAEDLVPLLNPDGSRFEDTTTAPGYTIHRYCPRIEGLFARIERWTRSDGDVHWRSISKDNILTIYGKDGNARISDPPDPVNPAAPQRIFTWLICETRDDKGNAVLYEYKPEDGAGVDLTQAHERNRGDRDDRRRTANRYLKHIRYGNRMSLLDDAGQRPRVLTDAQIQNADWMFEVVFDYGEHDANAPKPDDAGQWTYRDDRFSSYRSGFEVRTCRLCQRVLMFHHFAGEEDVRNDCLVRSTDFTYSHEQEPTSARNPVYTFLRAVTQSGYKREGGGYLKRSLPPVEFEYSQPVVQDAVEEVDSASLENLPIGVDGAAYQWTDLHGEGILGILTEQAGAWFYKRNLSPISERRENGTVRTKAKFAPMECVALKPNLTLTGGQAQFMDLAGDGQPDLVVLDGPMPGLYEHDDDEGWKPFRPFTSRLNRDTRDPNLKLVDLDGDGHADVLITEDDAFVWHASLAEEGFGPAHRVAQALDEEKGPRLVFADSTQSIYLADMSGDGLTDLVRIRNGEVCYWPNLGYGRFGTKITMDLPNRTDHPPCFDHPDQFDHKRIRLADIDGSGTTDIIYLHRDGVRLYFNQSGNSWSAPQVLRAFPRVDDLVSITPTDLLGNGTACLVWSSPLPGDVTRPMRYVNLMGGRKPAPDAQEPERPVQKPHLLVSVKNNLGAETRVQYAPSTKFYLQDERDGKPWITRLPFPVHVVERVETYDRASGNRFVTHYAYHHGYFDGEEREFRGFGMVEQRDTEEFTALTGDGTLPEATNRDAASHVPPVLTKTWFHTGAYLDRGHISRQFEGEYYREPGLSDPQFRALLLPDTTLPTGLTLEEEREACRAFKGMMLRQEVYADDAPPGSSEAMIRGARTPYTVVEQNFTIRTLQPRAGNHHAVFFTHPGEAITYHYERRLVPILNGQIVDELTAESNPDTQWLADPRTQHVLTLEVDPYGNVLKEAAIGYGRRFDAPDQAFLPQDRDNQRLIHITYTENHVTNAIDEVNNDPDDYRAPLLAETRTYELRKPRQEKSSNGLTALFCFVDILAHIKQASDGNHGIDYEDRLFDKGLQAAETNPNEGEKYFRRLIEHVRTLYRPDDIGASQNDPLALLPLGKLEPLALSGETYKLAFTPGLLAQVFRRNGQALLPNPADVLEGQGPDQGGYVAMDDDWWIPSGRVFQSPGANDNAASELTFAQQHFFLPHRYRDPFGQTAFVTYDSDDNNPQKNHNLLVVKTEDAVGNTVTAGNDYRMLQPSQVTDPNGNRSEVVFDALGMVVGTAVMGKANGPVEGDSFADFASDLTPQQIAEYFDAADPRPLAVTHLATATTRILYDLDRVPACAATVARETHVSDLEGQQPKVQLSFSYSDGFGREVQRKVQAEPGPVPQRDANGKLIISANGQPVMTPNDFGPRWVGSGWTIFNNKGKPVRQYEPFFTDTHRFEFDVRIGVSPILFYDPVERVVATLHPNHSWEKVVFDPWQQATFDVNDTVTLAPSADDDVKGFFLSPDSTPRIPSSEYLPTMYGLRTDPSHAVELAARYPNVTDRSNETAAATKAAAHANTPTTAYFDTLGRPFLTVAHNKVVCPNHDLDGTQDKFHTRVELDIEGNQRAVRDASKKARDAQGNEVTDELGRIVMRCDYDLLGNRIQQLSMEAGERWMLNDVTGKRIRAWDSRGHTFRTEYDPLRRPLRTLVTGANPDTPNQELLTERLIYGEQHPEAELRNLRGVLYLQLDQAGAVTTEVHDFKGNLLRASHRLTNGTQYRHTVDWRPVDDDHVALPLNATDEFDSTALQAALALRLKADTYTSRTRYDALNRPIQLIAPYSDQPGAKVNVIQPIYNEANLLEQVHAWLNEDAEPAGWLDPATANLHAVTDIDYDVKGQRTLIEYGSGAAPGRQGVTTTYTYDPLTFRLVHLLTRRNAVVFPDDCPQPPPTGWPGCQVQNLHYTYDPVGNITHIRDDAQQTIYFHNHRVEPSAEYTYDAIYRLIEATGREHLGQIGGTPIPHSYNDAPRVGVLSGDAAGRFSPNDGRAMGTYIERYVYDAVGNFLSMRHIGSDPAHPGWTRAYTYEEKSLIEDGTGSTLLKTSNRLSSTTVGNGNPITEPYGYDAHGNMTRMPQLQIMQCDFKDQLSMTQRQKVNDEDVDGIRRQGERTYYIYDAAGQRVREITELANGDLKDERIYLGGFEIYRQHSGANAGLVRESLHIMDNKQRIALVETRNDVNDGTAKQLTRYQFSNHLGSSSLELDDQAQVISYEEYTPYGSTSYQAVRSQTGTPKRYRYTGKERDEESGFYYHGARFYAPWLGRWTKPDPAGLADGLNRYAYASNHPPRFTDPTGTTSFDHQLWLAEQLKQDVRATRSGRGFDKHLHGDMQKAWDAFGPAGDADVGHVDKPFVLTRKGEITRVAPQAAGENRSIGATSDKAAAQAARKTGEFARTNGVDVGASAGSMGPRPPQAMWRAPVRAWTGPVPAQGPPMADPAATSSPPPTGPSAQLELQPVQPKTPGPAPQAAPKPAATVAPVPAPASTPPPAAEPGPAAKPPAASAAPEPAPAGGAKSGAPFGTKADAVAMGALDKALFVIAVGEEGKDHDSAASAVVKAYITTKVIEALPMPVKAGAALVGVTVLWGHLRQQTITHTERALNEGAAAADPALDQAGRPYQPPKPRRLGDVLGF